jgi:hypothetical protein
MAMTDAKLDRKIVQAPHVERPHLVILGAGASLAAFPEGDRNGRVLPLMRNIVEVCGLRPILEGHGIPYDEEDFEAFFSALHMESKHQKAVQDIEEAVYGCFAAMELPDHPTLYDHIVLSLRPKDVIATFNWDPFLWRALERNRHFTTMPHALFLHGNVAIGYCMRHEPASMGPRDGMCARCGEQRQISPLLYPVTRKDYNSDQFIAKSWKLLQGVLEGAFVVTVFGYSAPKTDVEAVAMLKQGWGDRYSRSLEQIEIIDVKDEDLLRETWAPFIHTHHYQCVDDFYKSYAANHPRRACDALWATLMDIEFIDKNPLPRDASWDELYDWFAPILADERAVADTRSKAESDGKRGKIS